MGSFRATEDLRDFGEGLPTDGKDDVTRECSTVKFEYINEKINQRYNQAKSFLLSAFDPEKSIQV